MALPFLPPEHIEGTYHYLDQRVQTDELNEFMDYVWRQWFRHPSFRVRNWSVYMLSVRTNNDLEGWHNRLNSRMNSRLLYVWTAVALYHSTSSCWRCTKRPQTSLCKPGSWPREKCKGSTGSEPRRWMDSSSRRGSSTMMDLSLPANFSVPVPNFMVLWLTNTRIVTSPDYDFSRLWL